MCDETQNNKYFAGNICSNKLKPKAIDVMKSSNYHENAPYESKQHKDAVLPPLPSPLPSFRNFRKDPFKFQEEFTHFNFQINEHKWESSALENFVNTTN